LGDYTGIIMSFIKRRENLTIPSSGGSEGSLKQNVAIEWKTRGKRRRRRKGEENEGEEEEQGGGEGGGPWGDMADRRKAKWRIFTIVHVEQGQLYLETNGRPLPLQKVRSSLILLVNELAEEK
jgi:hypothetical protein